jgi:hypothetical protein
MVLEREETTPWWGEKCLARERWVWKDLKNKIEKT